MIHDDWIARLIGWYRGEHFHCFQAIIEDNTGWPLWCSKTRLSFPKVMEFLREHCSKSNDWPRYILVQIDSTWCRYMLTEEGTIELLSEEQRMTCQKEE